MKWRLLSVVPPSLSDTIVRWLEDFRAKSLKLDGDSYFSITYVCCVIGYTSGILNDGFSSKCEEMTKSIRKIGDYFQAIHRVSEELISIRRGADFTLN